MAVITIIPWKDRLQMLSTLLPSDRLKLATSLLSKHASIAEVSNKISSAVDENLTKQQKEYYLRQQLQAIQRELGELNRPGTKSKAGSAGSPKSENDATSAEFDEEGDETEYFADIRSKIEKMAVGSEERKMGVKEFRRLKRIPAASVEQGVIRTYVGAQMRTLCPQVQLTSI